MGVDHSGGKVTYRCRNGHRLDRSYVSIGYGGGMYSCDQCKSSFPCTSGRLNCESCQWDICDNCANMYKPKPNPVTQCHSGHILMYTKQYPHGSYSCDACKRSFPCNQDRWCCTYCKYDVCPFCRVPPSPGPMPGPFPQPQPYPQPQPHPYPQPQPYPQPYPQPQPYPAPMPGPIYGPSLNKSNCPAGHTLMKTDYAYPEGYFKCVGCGSEVNCAASERYGCTYCKHDICMGCYNS